MDVHGEGTQKKKRVIFQLGLWEEVEKGKLLMNNLVIKVNIGVVGLMRNFDTPRKSCSV